MKHILALTAAALCAASFAQAQDFSEGSQAKERGFFGEVPARFTGKVVDIVCEVTGNCAENCGAGTHQLGILRDADGVLVPVLKNRQNFIGGAEDLLPYCNQTIEVDGLLVGEPDYASLGAQGYMLLFTREIGAEKWTRANAWTKVWQANHPEAEGKGPWFRRDPRVLKQLAESGHFGVGLEADQKYLEENAE
ncbi:MAG: hypothetical protein AAGA78_05255 [Pseudomonadota bacterium]